MVILDRDAEIRHILETDDTAIYFTQREKERDKQTRGWNIAYWQWRGNLDNNTDAFEVFELPHGSLGIKDEMQQFVDALREAGIERIIVTDSSTALMRSLHELLATGCTLEGPATVTRKNRWSDDDIRLGLEVRLA